LYLLLELFAPLSELDDNTSEYLHSFHEIKTKITDNENVKISKLWEIADIENTSEKISQMRASKERLSLIVGEDILTHPRWENLAYIVGLLERLAHFEVVVIPTETNTLGVSLICDLDEHCEGRALGYNRKGYVSLNALGCGDLDMPALNQQEGTFTNIDKRVVPTNAALPYLGYELNDIANALEITSKYAIDYTKKLPKDRGFKGIEFDELENYYDNAGREHRGYILNDNDKEPSKTPFDFKEFFLEGDLVYRLNPPSQFSPFVNKARQTKKEAALYVSNEFLSYHKLCNGDKVKISSESGAVLSLRVEEDKNISGKFAYLPTFDKRLNIYPFFSGYRFAKFRIERVK
jgi:NADH-quinone oxidoreductase subunit G